RVGDAGREVREVDLELARDLRVADLARRHVDAEARQARVDEELVVVLLRGDAVLLRHGERRDDAVHARGVVVRVEPEEAVELDRDAAPREVLPVDRGLAVLRRGLRRRGLAALRRERRGEREKSEREWSWLHAVTRTAPRRSRGARTNVSRHAATPDPSS